MRALVVLGLIAACDAGVKPESSFSGSAERPVIIVTKSEITYEGQLVVTKEDASAETPCAAVVPRINAALLMYAPGYVLLAGRYSPRIFASCLTDAWPEELRRCIVLHTPKSLVEDHACDRHVSDKLARDVAARVVPELSIRPEDFLKR